jgi:uncharacterized HAD superfamily protein
MRIGIDLDDVLADSMPAILEFYNKKYNKNFFVEQVKDFGLWKLLGISKEQMIEEVNEFLYADTNILPVEYSREIVDELVKNNDLVIITSRTDDMSKPTLAWVSKHFPKKFSEVHFSSNWLKSIGKTKADICRDLGICLMVEDSIEMANELSSNGIRVLLLDKGWNKSDNLQSNITRISSWKEVLENIKC